MLNWKKTASLFISVLAVAKGQLPVYPSQASDAWNDTTTGVFSGNGVFISPDDAIVVSISETCTVRANDAMTGLREWTFVLTGDGNRCFGGVTFNYEGSLPYVVFSVADNDAFDTTLSATT